MAVCTYIEFEYGPDARFLIDDLNILAADIPLAPITLNWNYR